MLLISTLYFRDNTGAQYQTICLKNGAEVWNMANKANDITGPGSGFYENKHVWFWGLFTNEDSKMLENG